LLQWAAAVATAVHAAGSHLAGTHLPVVWQREHDMPQAVYEVAALIDQVEVVLKHQLHIMAPCTAQRSTSHDRI
jgi:hypothetical protein